MCVVVELFVGVCCLVIFMGVGVLVESGIFIFCDVFGGFWVCYDLVVLVMFVVFVDDFVLVWGWYEWCCLKVLGVQLNFVYWVIVVLSG